MKIIHLLLAFPMLFCACNCSLQTKSYLLNNKFLADWEQPENDENPILVVVEP